MKHSGRHAGGRVDCCQLALLEVGEIGQRHLRVPGIGILMSTVVRSVVRRRRRAVGEDRGVPPQFRQSPPWE
jgi:hypothetical protein